VVARSLKDDGTVGSTKSDRFRRVEIGPELAARWATTSPDGWRRPRRRATARCCSSRRSAQRGGQGAGWSSRASWARSTGHRLARWHKEALQDAGLRDMPLHALRHTASAAWLSTGRR
jgi:integrase